MDTRELARLPQKYKVMCGETLTKKKTGSLTSPRGCGKRQAGWYLCSSRGDCRLAVEKHWVFWCDACASFFILSRER